MFSWLLVNLGKASTNDNPLFTVTFYELGYNTTQTYHQNERLTLQMNCSGSSLGLYSTKIHLHITGEDTLYSYWLNEGPLRSGGSNPGCSFFTGWQETYLEPGHFREGANILRIVVKNCDDGLLTTSKYLMIITDSYIEIYDGPASSTTSNSLGEFVAGVLVIASIVIVGLVVGYVLYSRRNNGTAYKKSTAKTYIDKNGYLRFKDSDKLVHRWVMEKRIRRKLKRNEDVHHIDGNKLNNNISNLQLMKAEDHHQLHLEQWKKNE